METKKLIGGLLAGAAIGVAVGLLLAPRSGEQTQKKIMRGSKKFTDDLKKSVNSSIDTIRDKYNSSIDTMKDKYNGSVNETEKRGKEVLSSVSDRVKV